VDTPRLLKDRYRLGRIIGRGGMGLVWLATDEVLDRKVAVKEVAFPPGVPAEERDKLRRRTLREARTNARLSHPNVVALYDIVEDEDRPWIVMEYVPSRSLAETVREDGPLTPERTADIGLQLLSGLRAAHAAGVLHRDVKPSNVLLAEDGRVVLGDFGIATAKGGSTVTSSGVLIGSPSYMAPERARGHKAGPESDLWSLGATLYTAVEGRPPFDRDSAVATLAAIVMDDPDPPERAGELWPLLRMLLRRDAPERPAAATVERMLRAVAGGRDAAPGSGDDGRPRDEGTRRPPARAGWFHAPRIPRPRSPLDESLPQNEEPDDAEPVMPAGEDPAAGPDRETAGEGGDLTVPGARDEDDATGTAEIGGGSDTVPAPPDTGGSQRTGGAGARRGIVPAGAAVVVLAVIVLAGSGLFGGGGHSARRAPVRHSGTARHSASASPTGGSPTASAHPAPSNAGVPPGFRLYHDRTGFSIAVPGTWSVSHRGHFLYVQDPGSARYLIVDQSDSPKSDPLADWREQEANRISTYPGYHRVRLEAVSYPPAEKTADWEFTYDGSHGRTHVLNRNILANRHHAYALYWSTPAGQWNASRTIFETFAASFRPAKA
jgi:hypothetical protein